MDVLLVLPPSVSPLADAVFMHEPLALEYLGAGLKEDGHIVTVVDARVEPDIESVFLRTKPDLVGITGTTSQLNIVLNIARRLKAIDPEILVVVGGHHATVSPEDLGDPAVDLVVIGEGVFALKEIAARPRGSDYSDIAGLAIPSSKGMHFTEPRPHPDLDTLPFPDRSLTAPYRKHYFNEWLKPLASVRTSLGCTSRCSFCSLWAITDGRYLRRSADSVVRELAEIQEPNVFFCDDESMCDAQRMDRLADAIASAGIGKHYFLYARADTIARHPDLFAKWRDIGLVQVFVGMETFSDEALDGLQKEMTVRHQEEAARILDELGVLLYANFMVDPAFTKEDFREMGAHVRRLGLRYASFSVLTPLPGTQLYEERKDDLISDSPELCDMIHTTLPTTLPIRVFYRELYNLFTRALPAHVTLKEGLRRFGAAGMVRQLGLVAKFKKQMDRAHLDHRQA